MSEHKKNMTKILILGLDNSGKTSILLSIQQKTNLLTYYSLKPTTGINIVNLEKEGTTYNIWEFGGQEQYREEYLKNLKKYMQEAKKFIYVIDVQDINRYDLALQYFKNIFTVLKSEPEIQISVFLHKYDPDLEKQEEYSFKKISNRLIKKISDIIPPDFNYYIFKTTIYTVFEKSLLESVADDFISIL